MIKKEVELRTAKGIYARTATLLVRKAAQFKSDITIEYDGIKANAKSLINVLTLAVPSTAKVTLLVSGDDEGLAAEEMVKLLNSLD